MHVLSAEQILQVWEMGQGQHPIDRALTLLSAALPARSRDDLSYLSIGQRDALLLLLREQMLGETLESVATCPHCGEPLEFALQTTQLRLAEPTLSPLPAATYEIEGYTLTVTLPNSRDLAAIVRCADLVTAQATLTQQCVQHVSWEGREIAADALPESVLDQLSQQLSDWDPQAELLLDLPCPVCQADWQVLFDIVSFFWTELSVQAKRLLRDVHTLARSYGWREADILAMSSMRRQFYLDLIDA